MSEVVLEVIDIMNPAGLPISLKEYKGEGRSPLNSTLQDILDMLNNVHVSEFW